jgi:hypothetical protein
MHSKDAGTKNLIVVTRIPSEFGKSVANDFYSLLQLANAISVGRAHQRVSQLRLSNTADQLRGPRPPLAIADLVNCIRLFDGVAWVPP